MKINCKAIPARNEATTTAYALTTATATATVTETVQHVTLQPGLAGLARLCQAINGPVPPAQLVVSHSSILTADTRLCTKMKASILWTLLPVVATTTNALHVPIKPRDDQFRLTTPSPDADTSSHKIATTTTPFDERPLASAEDILFADTTESTGDWPCHLHGWVRAPDLQPDTVIPAEARLVVNGTKCDMITKWQVGLRFKERAVIKRK